MKYLLSIIFCLSCCLCFGQQTAEKDMLFLKNGSIFIGKLTAYGTRTIEFKMEDGLVATFTKSEVKKMVMAGQAIVDTKNNSKDKSIVDFDKRGLYNITYGSFNSSSNAYNGNLINGLGVDNITGKQFNKYVGLGLGIGFHSMYPGVGENNMPVFLDFRGYLKEKKVSPYYNLAAGYAFAFKNEEKLITDVKGGFMFHPALGFKIGSSENSFMVDVGLKWTRNTFVYDRGWEIREHKMTYERLVVRIGLML